MPSPQDFLILSISSLVLCSSMRAETLWENPTRKTAVAAEYGKTYTASGTVRVQKIQGRQGPIFPYVLLPDHPIRVRLSPEDLRGNPPVPPEEPMRIVVVKGANRQITVTLKEAEGERVEVSYVLNANSSEDSIHTVFLYVKSVRILDH